MDNRSPTDTPPEVQAILLEGYRRMSPAEKLGRVIGLNRAVDDPARARLRKQYGPDLLEREEGLRLAALHLDRETMIRVFDWTPRPRSVSRPSRMPLSDRVRIPRAESDCCLMARTHGARLPDCRKSLSHSAGSPHERPGSLRLTRERTVIVTDLEDA